MRQFSSKGDRSLRTNGNEKYIGLERRVFEVKISETFCLFDEFGIQPVLFKGWVAANNYPESHRRRYTDLDIAVSASQYESALKQLPELFRKHIPIDLHNELRHLDTLPWGEFFDRCETREIQGVTVRVPCPEDHLRILSVHWLTDGGEYRERLWDIYYAVANRPADFDWDKCLGCVSNVRREWVIVCIGLAHKYLGLDIDDLPFKDEAGKVPDWICVFLEREWKRKTRLIPLRIAIRHPKLLFAQIKKRIPPNPIHAIIDTESSLNPRFLLPIRIWSMFRRSHASLLRLFAQRN